MRRTLLILVAATATACAALHRTQLADVEPTAHKGHRVSVKVSENTIDFAEMASLAKSAGHAFHSPAARNVGKGLDTYVQLFQYGPRTGTPVYNELYARYVPELLRKECPRGHLSNIMSLRETREYPVVKGEIVRIDAYCAE